jgi:hypothetical protein
VKSEVIGRVVAGALATAVALSLGACSLLPETTPTAHLELPSKNEDLWVMPLDSYTPPVSRKPDYGMALLEQPCMDSHGFKRAVPWQDPAALDAPLRSVFNVKVAEQKGYHVSAVTAPPASPAWTAFAYRTLAPGEQSALDACIAEAYKKLPPPSPSENLAPGLAQTAFNSSLATASVKAADQKWKACMRPYGVIDLPDYPGNMPSPSLVKKFDLGGSPQPSADEIKLAVADAACRDSSGWTAASYNAEWDAQVVLLRKNQSQLDAAKRDIDDYNRRVSRAISANEPAH